MMQSEFYTPRGYRRIGQVLLTESMEDYIEMIYRIANEEGFARISDLSLRINVTPSSASKMVSKLGTEGFVLFPKYGVIQLTEKGRSVGEYLLWRHETLEDFLRLINGTQSETRQVEQIEHFISEQTAKNIERAARFLAESGWDAGAGN